MNARPLALLILCGSVFVSGCASTIKAATSQDASLLPGARRAAWQLMSPDDPFRCVDPAVQRTSAEVLKARTNAWVQGLDSDGNWLPGVVLPEMTYRAPIAEYPTDMAASGQSGVVVMLLLIEADGSVADVMVACSTHPRLEKLAVTAARQNRYSPARLGSQNLRSVARLPYVYSVEH